MNDEIIVEDNDIVILTPKRGIIKGHLIISPIKPFAILEQIPTELLAKMFQVANRLSSILFEKLGCQGTNILIQNGVPAGQINKRFCLNIIPRYENDGLKLDWTPKKASDNDLETSKKKFLDANELEENKKILDEIKKKSYKKDEIIIPEDKDNYLVKSLSRTG